MRLVVIFIASLVLWLSLASLSELTWLARNQTNVHILLESSFKEGKLWLRPVKGIKPENDGSLRLVQRGEVLLVPDEFSKAKYWTVASYRIMQSTTDESRELRRLQECHYEELIAYGASSGGPEPDLERFMTFKRRLK